MKSTIRDPLGEGIGITMFTAITAPDTESGDTLDIGSRIRSIRKKRSWTLVDAAKRFGIGRSTLAKVESGQMSPTVGLLQKIAQGLQVDITALLSQGTSVPAAGRLAITRAGQGQIHETHEHVHELLGAGLASKRMLPFHSRIKASKSSKRPQHWFRHNAEEFVFVLTGRVTLHSEFYAPTELVQGDSVYLDGRMGHYFVAEDGEDAHVLFVVAE